MIIIFAVMGVLYLAIVILNRIAKPKAKNSGEK
jgi:hypothetical protein